MRLPLLTAMILVFIVWLQYEIRKASRISRKTTDNFWQKEKNANLSRRADISDLDFITVITDRLPMQDHTDQTINSYRDTINKLSGQKIINLSGLTNTDLKYQYGAANLNLLTEYDNNYTLLVSILQKWAERLYVQGSTEDCILVLEYAVSCHTDVSKSYLLLADLYKKQYNSEKITELIHRIPETKLRDKDKLVKQLEAVKNS